MTLEQTVLRKIEEAFASWDRAGKPGLFRTFLERQEEGITDILLELPDVRTTLARTRLGRRILAEVDKAPPHKAVSDNILAQQMDRITRVYQRAAQAGSFQAFLERIRRECSTEEDLGAFLKRLNE